MTRRKGEITDKIRNRTHPFQVQIVVPNSGLHGAYEIMFRWASRYDFVTTRVRPHWMRWCFRSREVADAFAMDNGGDRFDMPSEWATPEPAWEDLPANERRRRESAMQMGLERLSAAAIWPPSNP